MAFVMSARLSGEASLGNALPLGVALGSTWIHEEAPDEPEGPADLPVRSSVDEWLALRIGIGPVDAPLVLPADEVGVMAGSESRTGEVPRSLWAEVSRSRRPLEPGMRSQKL
jgi:hypothetical protein